MNKFKVDDKVKCIDVSNYGLIPGRQELHLGRHYKVTKAYGNRIEVIEKIATDTYAMFPYNCLCDPCRFELIEDSSERRLNE